MSNPLISLNPPIHCRTFLTQCEQQNSSELVSCCRLNRKALHVLTQRLDPNAHHVTDATGPARLLCRRMRLRCRRRRRPPPQQLFGTHYTSSSPWTLPTTCQTLQTGYRPHCPHSKPSRLPCAVKSARNSTATLSSRPVRTHFAHYAYGDALQQTENVRAARQGVPATSWRRTLRCGRW